jgi:hypothetical protein
MNDSLQRALIPGGRLAIIDFAPDSGQSAPAGRRDSGEAHGVTTKTVIDELRQAGFANVQQQAWPSGGYFLVVAERARAQLATVAACGGILWLPS